MVTLILSVALTAWSAVTLWLISSGGRSERVGFLVGIACQGLWIAFDLWTGAYGLLPLALIYAPMYWRGYRRHRAVTEVVGEPPDWLKPDASHYREFVVVNKEASDALIAAGVAKQTADYDFDPPTYRDKDPLSVCTACRVFAAGPTCWKCGDATTKGSL